MQWLAGFQNFMDSAFILLLSKLFTPCVYAALGLSILISFGDCISAMTTMVHESDITYVVHTRLCIHVYVCGISLFYFERLECGKYIGILLNHLQLDTQASLDVPGELLQQLFI